MNALRQKLGRMAYLVALAGSTVGWAWLLFQGVGWVLGV
jgi:hypothetical protein